MSALNPLPTFEEAWQTCRFCGMPIQPIPDSDDWGDIEGWDTCQGQELLHTPTVESERSLAGLGGEGALSGSTRFSHPPKF